MEEPKTTLEELFKVVLIDRKRKVKLRPQLRDQDGDVVDIRETIEKLIEYVGDKMREETPNICNQQIMPLLAQAMTGGLVKLTGSRTAILMLSQEHIRFSLSYMMMASFYMMKWIQSKNIKIHTIEEHVTQEEIDMYDRVSKLSDISVQASQMGISPKEVIKKMLELGQIEQSDLEMIGKELYSDDKKKDDDSGAN